MNEDANNLRFYIPSMTPPKEALKPFMRAGGFKGTDINAQWRIKQLTTLFGPCGFGWYYEVTRREILQFDITHQKCLVDINLYIRDPETKEWSKPIVGTGGNDWVSKSNKDGTIKVNDELYKMAITDALGNACKSLGFGASVYWDQDRTKYTVDEDGNYFEVVTTEEELKKQQAEERRAKADSFLKKEQTESDFVTADNFQQKLDAETRAKMKKATDGRMKLIKFDKEQPDCTIIQDAKDVYGDNILDWGDGAVLHVIEALEEVGLI